MEIDFVFGILNGNPVNLAQVSRFDPSVLVDALWMAQCPNTNLIEFCRNCLSAHLLPIPLMLQRLEPEFLGSIGLLNDPKLFTRKLVRANTALLYKQNKFNLLREESEGYSKLVVQTLDHLPLTLPQLWYKSTLNLEETRHASVADNARILNTQVASLIGFFDLDPNRVLDILLDMFGANVTDFWDFFIALLQNSPWGSGRGRDIIAQILGFKFGYYSELGKPTPPPLFWMAALLVKHDLVTLDHLYPHLSPDDDQLLNELELLKIQIQKDAKLAGRFTSRSALSGPLDEPEAKEPLKDEVRPSNQKAHLVSCLVAIGDLAHARVILDRQPILSQLLPEMSIHFCRLLHVIVDSVYKPLNPMASILEAREPPSSNDFCPPSNSLHSLDLDVIMGKKANAPKTRFFYPQWKDSLPRPTDYNGVLRVLRVLLVHVGSNLHRDIPLFTKLIRIGSAHLSATPEDVQAKNTWLNIISLYFFPGLSHTSSNPGLSRELWILIRNWPYTTRYALYGEWKHHTYKKIPDLKIALMGCEKDCRYIMARLSKETVKQYGRHIGKVVHSNPVICFSYIIKQLESYDNMIPHVVDASRYLTPLEFDVISYCLIEALADRKKPRVEENGTSFSLWLKSLATFSGALFRRHSVDLSGMLQYITNQLICDNAHDLIVLQELVASMTGLTPIEDATEKQLDALAGGHLLKRQSLLFESIETTFQSTERLVQCLVDTQLAMPIAILIGQQLRDIMFRHSAEELKILGTLSDHVQRSFLQYLNFIETCVPLDQYREMTPSFSDLVCKYGLPIELAFGILRPCHISIDSMNSAESNLIWNDGTDTQLELLETKPVCLGISTSLYISFWQLSCYDIHVPNDRYEYEIQKQKASLAQFDLDKSEYSSLAPSKKLKEMEKVVFVLKQLQSEQKTQQANFEWVRQRIQDLKPIWHIDPLQRGNAVHELIQNCLYVRCLLSPADAIFSAKFLNLIHSLGIENLATLAIYDRLLNRNTIRSILFSLTETEAKHYGLFLSTCLGTLTRWRQDEELYVRECVADGLTGFLSQWPENPETVSIPVDIDRIMTHETFKQFLHKWHLKLRKAFLDALNSTDYIQIRNAIFVLDKISEFYPLTREVGVGLERASKMLEETESRQDLKQLARSYYAKLQSRKSHWNAGELSILTTPEVNRTVSMVSLSAGSVSEERTDIVAMEIEKVEVQLQTQIVPGELESGQITEKSSGLNTPIIEFDDLARTGPKRTVRRASPEERKSKRESVNDPAPRPSPRRDSEKRDDRDSEKRDDRNRRDSEKRESRSERETRSDRDSNREARDRKEKYPDRRSDKTSQIKEETRRDDRRLERQGSQSEKRDESKREPQSEKRDDSKKSEKRESRSDKKDESRSKKEEPRAPSPVRESTKKTDTPKSSEDKQTPSEPSKPQVKSINKDRLDAEIREQRRIVEASIKPDSKKEKSPSKSDSKVSEMVDLRQAISKGEKSAEMPSKTRTVVRESQRDDQSRDKVRNWDEGRRRRENSRDRDSREPRKERDDRDSRYRDRPRDSRDSRDSRDGDDRRRSDRREGEDGERKRNHDSNSTVAPTDDIPGRKRPKIIR